MSSLDKKRREFASAELGGVDPDHMKWNLHAVLTAGGLQPHEDTKGLIKQYVGWVTHASADAAQRWNDLKKGVCEEETDCMDTLEKLVPPMSSDVAVVVPPLDQVNEYIAPAPVVATPVKRRKHKTRMPAGHVHLEAQAILRTATFLKSCEHSFENMLARVPLPRYVHNPMQQALLHPHVSRLIQHIADGN
ncbi:MAG: hypothetical protein JKY23_00405 [Nitrospinaceae bacterium]|nr:hypothetical protein [Nitrospinaceae bacterium]